MQSDRQAVKTGKESAGEILCGKCNEEAIRYVDSDDGNGSAACGQSGRIGSGNGS